jgi:hypothetical protein
LDEDPADEPEDVEVLDDPLEAVLDGPLFELSEVLLEPDDSEDGLVFDDEPDEAPVLEPRESVR